MEFMLSELMNKIEKLDTRFDGGRCKKVEKLGKRRVLLETLQMKPRMILTIVVDFIHIGERGMRVDQGGNIFDHIWIFSIKEILIIWEI